MNKWFLTQLRGLLWDRTRVKEEEIDVILNSLIEQFESKRLAVVPLFLSDEMFASIKETSPFLGYEEASRIYNSAISGHLK